MTQPANLLDSFAIGGYRSFGKDVQHFENLGKINLFIGQNNNGKSNVLRFLHDVYPQLAIETSAPLNLSSLDKHLPNICDFVTGIAVNTAKFEEWALLEYFDLPSKTHNYSNSRPDLRKLGQIIKSILESYAAIRQTKTTAWFYFDSSKKLKQDDWEAAFSKVNRYELQTLWSELTNLTNGGPEGWYRDTLRKLTPKIKPINVKMIPAIRQIGKQGSESEEFSGEGIIERLARLQNPAIDRHQHDKAKFKKINQFLCDVIDNPHAEIEIPHTRDTIHVQIDGRTLPLESLGTGIHEVIILAAAATILEEHVVCMEEPELHLHPLLQKS